jgi:predicted dehydrogenase
MLSGWHVHARGYAEELNAMPDVKITAVWDEEPDRGRKWAADLNVAFEPNLDQLLRRDDVDAVVVDAPTNRHAEVMIAAAEARKHIFTEKVMALTVKECRAIADAVCKAGVKFCISFPARSTPQHLFAKQAADEKLIGEVTLLRVRVAHDGASAGWLPPHFYDPAACGGGAMIDLGAHPMYLARWILGQPVRLTATFNAVTGHAVEDNAVAVIEFESKAIGIVETSFVSTHCPQILELYGTEGVLLTGGPENHVLLRSNKLGGKLQGWIRPSDLPPALPRPIRLWVTGIREGTPIPFGLDEGTQLTALMEAAYLSHREGRAGVTVARC